MNYIDGFLLVVPKKKLRAYLLLAKKAGEVWRDHGALEYRECVGDDLDVMKGMVSFPKRAQAKRNEAVVFSWILYKSKAHRNRVNAKVMKDPRMGKMMEAMMKSPPFDMKRMSHGGFKVMVEY
jgi:uncharacterized protein YbaA (DUF1428 family)